MQPDQELAGRARFIAAVADVVDSCLSDDQQRIVRRGGDPDVELVVTLLENGNSNGNGKTVGKIATKV